MSATAEAGAPNQSFGYDELERLTTSTTASWSIGYDANGNRTSLTFNGAPSVHTSNTTSNRLDAITNPSQELRLLHSDHSMCDCK